MIECPVCGNWFTQLDNLAWHINFYHSPSGKGGLVNCFCFCFCGGRFRSYADLQSHLRAVDLKVHYVQAVLRGIYER